MKNSRFVQLLDFAYLLAENSSMQSNKSSNFIILCASMSAGVLLGGYELVRGVSNTWFREAYGWENFTNIMAVLPIIVFIGVFIYGKILTRLGPRWTLTTTKLFWCFSFVFFYFLKKLEQDWVAIPFYFVRSLYIVLTIEQYWSYINSNLLIEEAKKRTGFMMGIASVGAVLGGYIGSNLVKTLGTDSMVLLGAASIFIPMIFTHFGLSDDFYLKSDSSKKMTTNIDETIGLKMFKKHPQLLSILLIVMCSQVISAVLQVRYQGVLSEFVVGRDEQTAANMLFYSWTNGVAMFFQFIATPLCLTYISTRLIMYSIPLVHIICIGVVVFWEANLITVSLALLAFKSIDYSIFRGVKEVMYMPLEFDAQYRAKELIDVFGYRFSKGVTSIIIGALRKAGLFANSHFAIAGLIFSIGWLFLVSPLDKSLKKDSESLS